MEGIKNKFASSSNATLNFSSIFGKKTTCLFKPISVKDLTLLKAEDVMKEIKKVLN